MSSPSKVDRDSWKRILASATAIFDELGRRQMGLPDIVMGGGTVLIAKKLWIEPE